MTMTVINKYENIAPIKHQQKKHRDSATKVLSVIPVMSVTTVSVR